MTSTWRHDKSKWGWLSGEYHYEYIAGHPSDPAKPAPVHSKTDKIPVLPEWQMHRLILFHASVPLLLHQVYTSYFGNMSPTAAAIFYSLAFLGSGIHQFNLLLRAGQKYGYLDGDNHARDEVPDTGVRSVMLSLLATVCLRMILAVVLSYNILQTPLQMDWRRLPVEVSLYGIVLDFWFYWYHRCMHDNESLWKYHRTHHLTKHPNALLSLYADSVQECIDILGIPLVTWITMRAVGLPMGFYEWWICHQYVTFAELTGHSGLRVHAVAPSPVTFVLRVFNAELVIEDHDLHHRKGWKKAHNYGKQTRLWDRIFGTCADRIESTPGNVDYDHPAQLPLL
jgi:sterol desaturase/sphingolipid hydroxylase (fatty acid hydroxylase superfamily)